MNELGYNYVTSVWRGLWVKHGTDPRIVEKLHEVGKAVVESEDWQAYLEQTNQESAYLGPDDFDIVLVNGVEETRDYLRELGIIN